MNKQFSFLIKVKGVIGKYSFVAPVENGFVITNYFCPNPLIIGESSFLSQIATPQQGESEGEFVQDCQNIVNKSNEICDDDVMFCLGQGLFSVVTAHINRCGRLLFQDLLLYMDCFAYLLKAVGYAEADIKHAYLFITKKIVDITNQYVKDSHTLLPFRVTNTYRILCRLTSQ